MYQILVIVFMTLYTSVHITSSSHYGLDCPTLEDADALSQTQLIERLTHDCRYDRLERPITYSENGEREPVHVYVRAYIYFLQNLETAELQFKIQGLLQIRFMDSRLMFRDISPSRRQPILGEMLLSDNLWKPHIFLANERDSSVMGTTEKDVLTSISPDGTVITSKRIKATLYCWMNLQKFPFDEQYCSIILESWMYNTSEMVLHWEQKRPITFDPALHLTEYVVQNSWFNTTIVNADLNDLRHGAFAGNYSSLVYTVHLAREIGFYLMDYFLPSMLIVGISWVSFWLQADQAAPRIMLGTSTMLTFITLASAQGKTLPKVSYIKVSEVWFLGCTFFIFSSLVEFAFVNTIWRRKENVNVKKINSKHILKSTISPRMRRRNVGRSSSFSALGGGPHLMVPLQNYNHYITVHNIPITPIREEEMIDSDSKVKSLFTKAPAAEQKSQETKIDVSLVENAQVDSEDRTGWTTLTPQEISIWIDRKARCWFPLCFLIFNACFWLFVYFL